LEHLEKSVKLKITFSFSFPSFPFPFALFLSADSICGCYEDPSSSSSPKGDLEFSKDQFSACIIKENHHFKNCKKI
jgi:hypothetical protein